MKLWLDDVRNPIIHGYTGFIWVKTAEEAIEYLKKGDVKFASLDHDLGEQATLGNWVNDGYDVILWMEENNIWPIDGVRVHSLNPVGRKRMEVVVKAHYGRNF